MRLRSRRREHWREIQQQVLAPLRQLLEQAYAPIAGTRVALLHLNCEADGPATIEPKLPPPISPGTLWRDAEVNHVPELLADFHQINETLSRIANDLQQWVDSIAQELLAESGLPLKQLPEPAAPGIDPLSLANYLYLRMNGLTQLSLEKSEGAPCRLFAGQQGFMFSDDPAAIERVLKKSTDLARTKLPDSTRFREKLTKLSVAIDRLIYHIAQAEKREDLPGDCGIVTAMERHKQAQAGAEN